MSTGIYPLVTGVYSPSEAPKMGNLDSQHQRFVGWFDFAGWILGREVRIARND